MPPCTEMLAKEPTQATRKACISRKLASFQINKSLSRYKHKKVTPWMLAT